MKIFENKTIFPFPSKGLIKSESLLQFQEQIMVAWDIITVLVIDHFNTRLEF